MRWLAALVMLTACDGVFGLTHLQLHADGGTSDVPTVDAIDGPPPCISETMHNEDLDALNDDCDGCPTVTSNLNDNDHDGLPNACDPNLSTTSNGDMILLASVFENIAEFDLHYTQGNPPNNAVVSSDQLVLALNANATTLVNMKPTKIVATITQFATINGTPQPGDKFVIGVNGMVCSVATSGCGGEQNQICLTLGPNTTHNIPAYEVQQLTAWSDSTGLHCQVGTMTMGTRQNDSTGTVATSKGFAKVETNARTVLSSLVFYGEKP